MKILLFGQDGYFVKKFSEYVSKKMPKHQLYCFTDENKASDFMTKQNPELILTDEGFLSEYANSTQTVIDLSEITVMPNEEKRGSLNVFQKASGIVDDLMKITALMSGKSIVDGKTRKVVFYSTEGGSGKTTIAYLTAVMSAKRRKTVYWNLEPCAFTDNLYISNFNVSMEQCIFNLQNGKIEETVYNTVVQNEDNVLVMPNIANYLDYQELTLSVIHDVCDIFMKMGVEVVILDLPVGVSEFTETLLDESQKQVWVFSETLKGSGKEKAFISDKSLVEWRTKSTIVRNRCSSMGKTEEGIIKIPNSDTIKSAAHLTDILRANPAFEKGCTAIAQSFFAN